MDANGDTIILVISKLVIAVGFIYGMYKWKNKSENKLPIIFYWIFGFFFAFVIPATLFDWILKTLFLKDPNQYFNAEYFASLGSLLGLALYIFIGVKLFRNKKVKIDDAKTTSNKTI